jgi:hypothetical protein
MRPYAAVFAAVRISSSFLTASVVPVLRLPKEEFPVLFIVDVSRVPLALASVLQHSAMVGDMDSSKPWPVLDPCLIGNPHAPLGFGPAEPSCPAHFL